MKSIISTSGAPQPIGAYSQAVLTDGLLFVSGQIPIVPQTGNVVSGDIEAQATQVMKNVQAILLNAGMDFSNVVKSTLFIADMSQYGIINKVYGSYFTEPPPARETVEVSKLPRGVGLELSVIAVK
jgi:2-iminobutanoate/2-iminopropanoate deaminase